MNRAVLTWRRAAAGGLCALALLAGLGGCIGPQIRQQSDDDPERVKYDARTVGDVTEVANVEPMVVAGTGLVVNLDGTGGSPPPGTERTMLEDSLRKNKKLLDALLQRSGCKDVKDLLNSPDVAMVRVTALIMPGSRKGDTLDVEVNLPPQSRASSLRGGYLVETVLHNYDTAQNLNPTAGANDRILKGHPVARAEGPLLVGFGDGEDAMKTTTARIWGGGRTHIDRPFILLMKSDQQLGRVAAAVADKINQSFHGSSRLPTSDAIATAKDNHVVYINVPSQYRLNLPRFLRVVRLTPLRETPEKPPADGVARAPYRKRLAEDLFDPSRAVMAALRLEALGADSVPMLKAGLKSDEPLVRFCAAESLAYLGDTSSAEVLADMVENHAALRAFSLTAMASLDADVCRRRLETLLRSPNAETRYGAFRALRTIDENDEAVTGELLNNSFWLHHVAEGASPLVHVTSSKRAEVVLFGEDAYLMPPFSFRSGEYTFVAGDADTRCTVSHFATQTGRRETRQCSLRVDDVLRTLAGLRGTYPEAVELLRQANGCRCMSSRMEVDRLPQAVSVYELARASTSDPDLLERDAKILEAKPEFGATPTLYEAGKPKRTPSPGAEASVRDRR